MKRYVKLYEEAYFQYDCVSPTSKRELQYIIDNSREITYKTFIKNVDKDFINDFNRETGMPIHKDYAVSFYKSKLPNGKPAWYFKHSAIEHVFY